MNLVLHMPFVDRSITTARVDTWHKHPGDPVVAGEPVCDLMVEQVTAMRRDTTADRMVRQRRRRSTGTTSRSLQFHVRLVASEAAVLAAHRAEVGTPVVVGDELATLRQGDGPGTTAFRVVASVLDPTGGVA